PAHQHRQADPRSDPNRGTRPRSGPGVLDQQPTKQLGNFVATTGQKPWPPVGTFVAAHGQFSWPSTWARGRTPPAAGTTVRPVARALSPMSGLSNAHIVKHVPGRCNAR